jgi:putative ATPase
MHAVQFIGLPSPYPLAQAVVYIAAAPKSNAAYMGINQAMSDVREKGAGRVPVHLRDASYKGAKQWGHGKDYRYPHSFPGAYVPQQYLPEELTGTVYYRPTDRGFEAEIGRRLRERGSEKSQNRY